MRLLLIAACALVALPGAALAQHPGRFDRGPGHPHFSAGPIGHFAPRDLAAWRGGYWWHGWRGGRLGWWWCADGNWYWYAAPVYPYPDVVADDYVPGDYPGPSAPMWYYCYDPPGYYPWVRACGSPWRPIPANPQPPPPPEQAPPPGAPPPQ
jgi:hypothetical protein